MKAGSERLRVLAERRDDGFFCLIHDYKACRQEDDDSYRNQNYQHKRPFQLDLSAAF